MEFLQITFQTAGINTYVFIPPVVAFVISFFTSMAGISGAFLLLPFQVSLLGFTSPSVSATNFLYNIPHLYPTFAGVCGRRSCTICQFYHLSGRHDFLHCNSLTTRDHISSGYMAGHAIRARWPCGYVFGREIPASNAGSFH